MEDLPVLTGLAGVGIVVGIAYMTRAIQQSFYSGTAPAPDEPPLLPLDPISIPERCGAVILLATTLLLGLYPKLLLDLIEPSLNSPLMIHVLKGAGP